MHQSSLPLNITPLYFLSSNFIYSAQKEPIPRFWNFWVLGWFFIDMTRTSLLLILSSIFTLDKRMPSKVSILRLSSALIKICQIPHVIPSQKVSFPSNFASLFSVMNYIPLCFLNSNIIYFVQKEPIKVQIFETFECSGRNSSNC